MDRLKQRIIGITEELAGIVVKYRRELHSHPELSGMEKETSAYVAAVLESNGIEVRRNVGGYGVVGLIEGKGEGGTVALRADMDALPLQDAKKSDYASKVHKVMHSCGHDVHTAVLLGTASVLSRTKEYLHGTVKLIFQPSEERPPGGAKSMIEEGVLEMPVPSAIVALHVFPDLPAGTIGCKPGMMTASSDRFSVVLYGRSGHGAKPHQTIDAVLVAAKVITTLQHIVSRRIDPIRPAVITIGTISGGTAENIVADRVELTGTVRSLDTSVREELPRLMEQVIKGITLAMGAEYEFSFARGNPSVVNDPKLTSLLMESGKEILGRDRVVEITEPTMGGEDFAFYAERVPACFFRLGTGNPEKGIIYPLHHRHFDIDEGAIPVGVKVLAWTTVRILNMSGRVER